MEGGYYHYNFKVVKGVEVYFSWGFEGFWGWFASLTWKSNQMEMLCWGEANSPITTRCFEKLDVFSFLSNILAQVPIVAFLGCCTLKVGKLCTWTGRLIEGNLVSRLQAIRFMFLQSHIAAHFKNMWCSNHCSTKWEMSLPRQLTQAEWCRRCHRCRSSSMRLGCCGWYMWPTNLSHNLRNIETKIS